MDVSLYIVLATWEQDYETSLEDIYNDIKKDK